jgi:hypothetical protein
MSDADAHTGTCYQDMSNILESFPTPSTQADNVFFPVLSNPLHYYSHSEFSTAGHGFQSDTTEQQEVEEESTVDHPSWILDDWVEFMKVSFKN